MNHLDQLESQSIYIIREAYKQFRDIAVLWSIGKDSTTMMHLVRKAFYGRVPFPAIHIDTGYKFKEIYDFRDRWSENWNLRLIVGRNEEAIRSGVGHKKKIVELYLQGYEYTEIERKTGHSGEAIMRYVKDFARLLILIEEGYSDHELRIITGLSDKTIREYRELIQMYYSTQEYQERLEKELKKIKKKDPLIFKAVRDEIEATIKNPYHYKPLRYDMKGLRRDHLEKSFVLVFEVDEQEKIIRFLDLGHHDKYIGRSTE